MRRSAAALLALAAATPAAAQDREFCPERPGLETQACIVDRGRVTIESSLIDWTRDRQSDGVTDTILVGDTLVRVGVTDRWRCAQAGSRSAMSGRAMRRPAISTGRIASVTR